MKIKESKAEKIYTPRSISITIESQEEEDFFKSFGNATGHDLSVFLENCKKLQGSTGIKVNADKNTCTDFLNTLWKSLFQ